MTVPKRKIEGLTKEEKDCALLIWRIPNNIKRRFKAQCVIANTSMREVIINFMKTYTNDGKEN